MDEMVRRADRLAAVGRTSEAIYGYQQALALEPDSPIIHYKLAEVLASAERLEEAVGHYRRAIAAQPESAAAHVGLGMAYGRLNDAHAAVRHYRAAARLEPGMLAAHYNLGIALGDGLGRYREAVDALGRALALAESAARADLVERITERLERFRGELAGNPDDEPR